MNELIINPKTADLIKGFERKPNSTLLLVGSRFSGLEEASFDIAKKLLGDSHKNSILIVEQEDSKKIGVQQIRDLKKSLTTKINTNTQVGRVAIVKNSEESTIEAQNALLKLIEEPVNNTLVILNTIDYRKLIPTIISRCQRIDLLPITLEQALAIARKRDTEASIAKKAYIISKGQANLYHSLLENNFSQLAPEIENAKQFLIQTISEKLLGLKKYSSQESLRELLSNLEVIAEASMHSPNTNTTHRWKKMLKNIQTGKEQLNASSNVKLTYLRLCLNL